MWVFFLPFCPRTCGWPVRLAEVARWRHGRHDEVEGDGDVHGGDVAGAGADHPDLVVRLKVHVGRAPCAGKATEISDILNI